MILVDTNVLIDLAIDDPHWADWSQAALDAAAEDHDLAVDSIVYSELSIRYPRQEQLDAMLAEFGIGLVFAPREALFTAGKAFQRYRTEGGIRTGVLPDFLVGAHALVAGAPLITRDASRYRYYFPGIELISPP